jgi:hypothetical protein
MTIGFSGVLTLKTDMIFKRIFQGVIGCLLLCAVPVVTGFIIKLLYWLFMLGFNLI